MIYPIKRTDVETVENNLAFQFVPVLLDMVVFHHDDHHINIVDELIETVELILSNLVVFQEWVITLQRTGKVTLLQF